MRHWSSQSICTATRRARPPHPVRRAPARTTALVLTFGGDEEQAIAALLHDAAEDQGGKPTLERIRRHFGDRVAEIVDACTETYADPKPEWLQRKNDYIARIPTKSADARLVSAADKLDNA